jgi:hypothetical protein
VLRRGELRRFLLRLLLALDALTPVLDVATGVRARQDKRACSRIGAHRGRLRVGFIRRRFGLDSLIEICASSAVIPELFGRGEAPVGV